MTKKLLLPTLSLFCICLVAALLLAFTNDLTADRIAEAARRTEYDQRAVVLPGGTRYEENDTYIASYDSADTLLGYIIKTESKGYGGTISVMTGILPDGTVSGVAILSHSETVGLGANTAKEDFLHQYNGGSDFAVGENITAVTGATISSKAVTKAVNEAMTIFGGIGQ